MHTVSFISARGELEIGRIRQLTTNVTTDHARSGWVNPPDPPTGPPRGGRGGGDNRPNRRHVYLTRALLAGAILLAAANIVEILELLKAPSA